MRNESGLRPMEFNVVVAMDPVAEKTQSGIYIPQTKVERDELACDEGTLVALSPLAFSYASEADWGEAVKPAAGDRVLFAQYQGRLYERNGVKYRLLKDKDIVAVIESKAALAAAA